LKRSPRVKSVELDYLCGCPIYTKIEPNDLRGRPDLGLIWKFIDIL
jgi:hypothetical protein